MKHKLVVTADGSHTFYIPQWNEHYHSKFGALEESRHLYIQNGFNYIQKKEVFVLEVGFGTGLNAILTFQEHRKAKKVVYYETIEKDPLMKKDISMLNYADLLDDRNEKVFDKIHEVLWEKDVELESSFILHKKNIDLLDYKPDKKFDIIYFDAFAPDLQPELWTEKVFTVLNRALNPGGILVTYSTKGTIKRGLLATGFKIEKIPGPEGGKKENLRAIKEC